MILASRQAFSISISSFIFLSLLLNHFSWFYSFRSPPLSCFPIRYYVLKDRNKLLWKIERRGCKKRNENGKIFLFLCLNSALQRRNTRREWERRKKEKGREFHLCYFPPQDLFVLRCAIISLFLLSILIFMYCSALFYRVLFPLSSLSSLKA